MTLDDATTAGDLAAEAQEQADFDAGGAAADPPKPGAASDPGPRATPAPAPTKYARVTAAQAAAWDAAAAKSAGYETQLSKAFGTIGDLQKKLTALQSGGAGGKFEIPKDAFAGMERDFPELAEHTRAALEATLRSATGSTGGAGIDPEQMSRAATQARVNAEIEALEDDHPDWRKIVGQVDISKEKPDPTNPFRKWLATKDAAYQARLNGTMSAAVISRAISRFQSEVKAPGPKAPTLQAQLQAARIRGAVTPRGDGGQAAPANTDEDEFEAGFAGR